ncbi:MAG: hypothetical protein LBD08_01925 [Treponema sp.]|jgi:hypothetical protein|nr:hypothetical protein [Treponema sp.]
MAQKSDWMPSRRDDILHMAKTWNTVLAVKGPLWGVPAAEIAELLALTAEAEAVLQEAKSGERNSVITVRCRTVFDLLRGKMRYIKDRYFKKPPLEDPDFPALLLHLKDDNPTSSGRPAGQLLLSVSYEGPHLLVVHCSPLITGVIHSSEWGYAVYDGIMPSGGASLEEAAGARHCLMHPSLSGDELLYWRFTRRKKEVREYAAEESSKTAYFCARCENQRGEHGAWGPVASAVIP